MISDKQVSRLHYISQEPAGGTHILAIANALRAGCKWIQLRVKNQEESHVLALAMEAKELCTRHGAHLIVNDYPEVAAQVKAYGLHLGLSDVPLPEARAIVGSKMVIGGTANTWADVCKRVDEGADYIGLGPFRFTETKQNLSPVLGIAGIRDITAQARAAGMQIPIIAIGGIRPADVSELLTAGVFGVAVSGSITNALDPAHQVELLYKQLDLDYLQKLTS